MVAYAQQQGIVCYHLLVQRIAAATARRRAMRKRSIRPPATSGSVVSFGKGMAMKSKAQDKTKIENSVLDRRKILLGSTTLAAASALGAGASVQIAQAQAQPAAPSGRRPNILVIFGDDIGQTNISAYSFGLMGYRTPNIDRIAREGMMFTDYYAEQSCTAGRSSFITGQCTLRTGLSKVGIPGAAVGLQARDATIAELLKPLGYATGQFGKNHLGDTQRISADGAWLRRVLRQPLSPQCRGGPGEPAPIRAIPAFRQALARAACCAARRPTATIRPSSRAGARSASRPSRTPARSPRSGWRRSTTRPQPPPSISCSGRSGPTRRSSAGSTRPACISAPMCAEPTATSRA